MKKPAAIRRIAKALIGAFLILAYCAIHGAWAQDNNSSATPVVQSDNGAGSDQPTPAPKKHKHKAAAEAAAEPTAEPSAVPTADDKNTLVATQDVKDVPQYVGADTCMTCHQDQGNALQHSSMGRLMDSRSHVPFDKSCETCHGPGSLHVEAAGNTTDPGFNTIKYPPKLPAPEANAICLTCHEAKAHFHWKGSPHDMKNVTCISCHTIHQDLSNGKKPNQHLLKTARLMDTCFTCHIDKKAQISRNGHMPLNEDEMTCTSCHDPHGTSGNKNLLGDSVNETCFKCHADKRGPFLWEHPPVQESCLNCHNPHGSNQDHMLVERPPFLCQRCHDTQHGVYDASQLSVNNMHFIGQGCLNCHSNIHGSNSPSGRVFQR